jgi:hypothetical protein
MEQRLASGLRELRKLLETASLELRTPTRFALIGGLAVATWGVIRATQDIDFLADSEPSPIGEPRLRDRLKNFLEERNSQAEWRVGDHDDPIPLLLRVELPSTYGRIGADILWAHRRWQQDGLRRAIAVELEGEKIPVLHPEDLILMKLDAGGPQDLLDVQRLLSSPGSQVNMRRLKSTASRLRLTKVLERCLRELHREK